MTSFRISVTVLAVIHVVFAGFTALVGAFANGGDVWQRLLMILLHPLGAAGVLLLVLLPHLTTKKILVLVALLTANRNRRPVRCAVDCHGRGTGRLGACVGIFGGSGHRNYLRAGVAPNGPRDGRIRLRLEPETLTWRAYAGAL